MQYEQEQHCLRADPVLTAARVRASTAAKLRADAMLVAGHAREFIAVRYRVGLPCSPAAPVLGLAAIGVAGSAADEASEAIAAADHRLRGDGVAAAPSRSPLGAPRPAPRGPPVPC